MRQFTGPLVTWQGQGLALEVTGIERFALRLFEQLVEHEVLAPQDLHAVAEPGAKWAATLLDAGVHVDFVRGRRWRRPAAPEKSVRLVHNLGGGLFPRASEVSNVERLYSVYDWGPYEDREMGLKARYVWKCMIRRGWREADAVHLLNKHLLQHVPGSLGPAPRAVVAMPESALAVVGREWELPPVDPAAYGLFIGTDMPRKRLGRLVELAESTETQVRMVGAGTERYNRPPYVIGLGRVSDHDLRNELDHAGFVVLLSEYEGFGLPVLEAASRGIRSVVSREVADILPDELRTFAYVSSATDAWSYQVARGAALSARGESRLQDFRSLTELVEEYRRALA